MAVDRVFGAIIAFDETLERSRSTSIMPEFAPEPATSSPGDINRTI
jgi:hypothetical protein